MGGTHVFDCPIGFTEVDLQGPGEEKANTMSKGSGEEIINMAVNIAAILFTFALRREWR